MTKTNYVDVQVGSRIRSLRNQSNLSIQEAATLINVSIENYAALEAGRQRFHPRQLLTLANNFGVEISEIFEKIGLREVGDVSRLNVVAFLPLIQ